MRNDNVSLITVPCPNNGNFLLPELDRADVLKIAEFISIDRRNALFVMIYSVMLRATRRSYCYPDPIERLNLRTKYNDDRLKYLPRLL
jgi:hypothetical protein